MRFAFFGSPPFAVRVFERLLESTHPCVSLVTLPDRPSGRGKSARASALVVRAKERSIEVLQPEKPHEAAFLERLRTLQPDVLLVASYGVILRRELLELAPRGALNVHASLLPRHRGASPIQAAILAGDALTGVCIQRMVLALDEGDVLLERRTPIGAEENAGELALRLSELGGEASLEALDQLERGTARFTPQDHAHATYARKLVKEQGLIDWTRDAVELARAVRAHNPWPLARTSDPKGRELSILAARASDRSDPGSPGTLIADPLRLLVRCGGGGQQALELVTVTPAGKRAMSGIEFLRGARLESGARLGA